MTRLTSHETQGVRHSGGRPHVSESTRPDAPTPGEARRRGEGVTSPDPAAGTEAGLARHRQRDAEVGRLRAPWSDGQATPRRDAPETSEFLADSWTMASCCAQTCSTPRTG